MTHSGILQRQDAAGFLHTGDARLIGCITGKVNQMKWMLELLPDRLREAVAPYTERPLEELRFCAGQPVILRLQGQEIVLREKAAAPQLEQILRNACRQSVYAHTETIRQGFVTVEGGHRIGVCGFGVMQDGAVQTVRDISSLNIRIARQIYGCAAPLLPQITGSAFIVGPPGSGKTTLLRDLIRLLSDERKLRVGIADERGELSAGVQGVPQLDVGMRTDVLVNIPKATAFLMLLRTMDPQWIAMDEVTSPEDLTAMEQAAYCGVQLLATAHADSWEELRARRLYRELLERGLFRTVILLNADRSYSVRKAQSL